MSAEEKMTIDERLKYLRQMKKRYQQANRQARSQLLDEMQAVTELHRKSLVRLLTGDLRRHPRRGERRRTYGIEVHNALRVLAESSDYVCAERLQPNLVWLAEHLAQHGELETTPALLAQLKRISVSTVRRIQRRLKQDQPRLPRKGPERANRVARAIPMQRIPWDEQQPGHFEVDLVHHSGPSASGHYVHTLQMVDVATGWSERVAVLGRAYVVMKDGFERILARLPFPVLEIHPDNGPEFLNDHLVRFWHDKVKGVQLSRSRPYEKNDNRFVEQKNDTLVRAYFGYARLDTIAHTNLLNQLYDRMWLYYNFFQPVMRLSEKTILPSNPGQHPRVKRRYDNAQTPCDRLLATEALSPGRLADLLALRAVTNPRQLRQEVYFRRDQLLDLPLADPQQTEDVYQTLLSAAHPPVDTNRAAADVGHGNVDNQPRVAHIPTTPTAIAHIAQI